MKRTATVLAAAALLFLTGCPGSLEDPDRFLSESGAADARGDTMQMPLCPPTINVERDILNAKCGTAGCHGTMNPQGNLDLATADIHGRIQGVASTCDQIPLLSPSEMHGGFLLEKVIESQPSCGSRMPPGPALSQQEVDCLREWAVNGNTGGSDDGGTGMDAAADAPVGMDAAMDAPRDVATMDAPRDAPPADAPRDAPAADSGCTAGQTMCDGRCVNTQTSPQHCGSCGNDCTAFGVCSNGTCTACGTAPSYATAIQPIWNNNCTNCHDATSPAAGLNLAGGASHAELTGSMASCGTNRRLVVPREALNSYLINKLTGSGMCSGSRMPSGGGTPLTTAQMGLVRNWICNGAMNN